MNFKLVGFKNKSKVNKIWLDDFFPHNTEYFYSFPVGEDSSFFTKATIWKEELIAMRPMVCSRGDLKVVTFAASLNPTSWNLMSYLYGADLNRNLVVLPKNIDTTVRGPRRNTLVANALAKTATVGGLVMAQPYIYKSRNSIYQMPPDLSIWLNDKKNMADYVPARYLPKRFYQFASGVEFMAADIQTIPCVVKVSSSCSGDGVAICHSSNDVERAKRKFKWIRGNIIIEEYINSIHNIGIQFGIPYHKNHPIEIIGYNQQLVGKNNEYLGGKIDYHDKVPGIGAAYKILLAQILPEIRRRGWYGVGGFDVLLDAAGGIYFIDANLRMTAATPYIFMVRNQVIKQPLLSFTGSFVGSVADFKAKILSLAKSDSDDALLKIIAIVEHDGVFYFNAAACFDNHRGLLAVVKKLLSLGVKSRVLKLVSHL
ncbi:MAG: ATP-grasp domain-containing protein [bacterium]|nr:ATP-grasp domain-containing protein [bacterium]